MNCTTLYGTIGTAAQNSITSATSLASVGTVTTGIWNSTFGSTSNTTISGSFTALSSSLASRLTSEEGEAEGSVVSSSAQIASDISGSWQTHLSGSVIKFVGGGVSGSSSSTGSFGRLEVAGNSNLTGNLTLGGNITLGDATSDSVSFGAEV